MSDRDIEDVLDRLVGSLDDEIGDWDDVLERSREPSHPVEEGRGGKRRWVRRGRWLPLLAGAVAVTALAALAIISPWQRGPSILDRAAAVIVSPAANQVSGHARLDGSATIRGEKLLRIRVVAHRFRT